MPTPNTPMPVNETSNTNSTLMSVNETSNKNSTTTMSYITAYPVDIDGNMLTSVLEITVIPEIANNQITVECLTEDLVADISVLINSGEHEQLF